MSATGAAPSPTETDRSTLPVVLIQAEAADGETTAAEHARQLYGADCQTVLVDDTAPAAICDVARRQRAVGIVLVVSGSTGRGPAKRVARIVRDSPCPVVLVTSAPDRQPQAQPRSGEQICHLEA